MEPGWQLAISSQLTYTDPMMTRFETKVGINKRVTKGFSMVNIRIRMDCRVRTYVVHTSSFFTLGTLGLVDLTISMKFMFLYIYILIHLGKATQTTYKIWPACYSFEVLNLRVSKG